MRVDAVSLNVYFIVFLDIYGGGGENVLYDMLYMCVNVMFLDECEIKDVKNGKWVFSVTSFWMVSNGEKVVKEFLVFVEIVVEVYVECVEMNKVYDVIKCDVL